ncbi:hypothetical protein N8256_00910, partial [Pelagibacteraceae bacterium]|nr:hypothetical protein [Pelagibacteraceae bacterium]
WFNNFLHSFLSKKLGIDSIPSFINSSLLIRIANLKIHYFLFFTFLSCLARLTNVWSLEIILDKIDNVLFGLDS